MIEGLKVPNKWGPISGSPMVNVSRVCPGLLGLQITTTEEMVQIETKKYAKLQPS